jgi:hypothetical protein
VTLRCGAHPGRRVATCAALVAIALAPLAPAGAAGIGDGGLGDGELRVGLEVYAPGSGGSDGGAPALPDGESPRPVRYEAVPARSSAPGLDGLCNAQAAEPLTPDTVVWGWWYTIVAIDNATGAVLSEETVCVPLPVNDPATPPAPPALPVPPTIAQIWRAAAIPAPPLGVSPAVEGVVGLDTWLWSGGATVVQIAVSLDGYTVSGTARLVEYRFDGGDGVSARAAAPGSRAAPAATHVYDVKGTYDLRVGSVWDADVTMTGPGIATPVPVAIGTAVVTTTRAYGVVEVRSTLVP